VFFLICFISSTTLTGSSIVSFFLICGSVSFTTFLRTASMVNVFGTGVGFSIISSGSSFNFLTCSLSSSISFTFLSGSYKISC